MKMAVVEDIAKLIPDRFISYNDRLEESIKTFGVLSPVIISDNHLCDGHKRLMVCQKLGIKEIAAIEVMGDPLELFFELNERDFDINTVALLSMKLTEDKIADICRKVGFSDSPQMIFAIKYLSKQLDLDLELINYEMPANVWRELGHIGENIDKYAIDLLKMQGTVGEKRNIAAFIRQAYRRGELPENIRAEKASDIIPLLQKTAQPRRTRTYEKYEKAVAEIDLPKGVSLKIDSTFAVPGVSVTIPLMGSELEKLEDVKTSLSKLFKAVPEL